MTSPDSRASQYLRVASQFHLGVLVTEGRHPRTRELSHHARHDLGEALRILRGVDLDALASLAGRAAEIEQLAIAVSDTLAAGHRIFLCGCGATGRLSLSLETLWLESDPAAAGRVVSFMAGGDVALIKSIENFEDYPEFGARQLDDLGFADGDLLIATTEGGETPFVIGATEHAARRSQRPPYFLYCNPDDLLRQHVERSRRVLDDPRIRKINLTVGPMSLAGSTRLQASTVLMLAVGRALFAARSGRPAAAVLAERINALAQYVAGLDLGFLRQLVAAEAQTYLDGHHVIYTTDAYGITVLTDTTERSPTFSLSAFENQNDPVKTPSLCYLCLPHVEGVEAAWHALLRRAPRPLSWPDFATIAGRERLLGFDFSSRLPALRQVLLPGRDHRQFAIQRAGGAMCFDFAGVRQALDVGELDLLDEHILLKLLLNMHSTLVMGRLGRYHGNLMTWVRPSNYKLIDRSVRYVQHLLAEAGIHEHSYEEIVRQCFAEMAALGDNEPVVLRTFEALRARTGGT
jgi:N-acetylmuramic acid 6-phosphate etherase